MLIVLCRAKAISEKKLSMNSSATAITGQIKEVPAVYVNSELKVLKSWSV